MLATCELEIQPYLLTEIDRENARPIFHHFLHLVPHLFPQMRRCRVYLERQPFDSSGEYRFWFVFKIHLPLDEFENAREAARIWGEEYAACCPPPRKLFFPLRLEVAE